MKIENIPERINAPIDWTTAICSESGDIWFKLAGHGFMISLSSAEILKLHARMIGVVASRPDWEENGCGRQGAGDSPISKLWLVEMGVPENAAGNGRGSAAVNGWVRS